MTQPDITYLVSIVSQFISTLWTRNSDIVVKILQYLKRVLERRLVHSDYGHNYIADFSNEDADMVGCQSIEGTTGYCMFARANIVL